MKAIPLTRGHVAIVDDCDNDWLSRWNWCYHAQGYAIRGRCKEDGLGSQPIFMQNVIMGVSSGVDHADRNSLNNQRANLRLATRSQNNANSGLSPRNTSGYRGVSWSEVSRKWLAQIWVDRAAIHLGLFVDPKDGARAYNEAAIDHYGVFAYQNLI